MDLGKFYTLKRVNSNSKAQTTMAEDTHARRCPAGWQRRVNYSDILNLEQDNNSADKEGCTGISQTIDGIRR